MNDIITVGAVAGAIAAVIGLGYLIHRVFRSINGLWRKVSDFLDDWNGEPPRRGYAGRLGVMERLARIESCVGLTGEHHRTTHVHVNTPQGNVGTIIATTTGMSSSAPASDATSGE